MVFVCRNNWNLLGAPIGGLVLDASASGGPVLWQFRMVFAISAISGMAALLLSSQNLGRDEVQESDRAEGSGLRRFRQGISEVLSDRRLVTASACG